EIFNTLATSSTTPLKQIAVTIRKTVESSSPSNIQSCNIIVTVITNNSNSNSNSNSNNARRAQRNKSKYQNANNKSQGINKQWQLRAHNNGNNFQQDYIRLSSNNNSNKRLYQKTQDGRL
ncbi:unnamed protein product, partial [Ceratitis capitata]